MRPIQIPRYNRGNTKSGFDKLLALVSLGIISYSAYINTKNLKFNRQQAISTNNIANQLDRINHSNFMYKLNSKLDEEQ